MSTDSSSSAGASFGTKVKGAFQSVHGIGESIRGNAMDFVDSATGTAQSNHDATVRGQQETGTGVSNMESRGSQNVAGSAPTTAPTAPTTTHTAMGALPSEKPHPPGTSTGV